MRAATVTEYGSPITVVEVDRPRLAPDGLADERGVRFAAFHMSPSGDMMATLAGMIDSGALHPIVDSVFPLSQVQQAFDHSDAGHARGKIIINVK
jgi:NADPH:quinone reductase-like Zn-dependent oxidoreductase